MAANLSFSWQIITKYLDSKLFVTESLQFRTRIHLIRKYTLQNYSISKRYECEKCIQSVDHQCIGYLRIEFFG